MSAQVWRFEQLGGSNRVLTLEGYSAPFGRPRKKPVVVEKISQKIQTVRYPGRNGNPTRHILGTEWGDLELSGRWMTKYLPGATSAAQRSAGSFTATAATENLVNDWTRFVEDGQRCRVSWGNIVSYTGIVESLELARESATEMSWKIKFLVDDRDGTNSFTGQSTSIDLRDDLRAFDDASIGFVGIAKQVLPTVADWQPDLLDSLGNIVSSINSFTSSFLKIANQFDDIRSAVTSELFRLQSSIRTLRTAIMSMEATFQTIESDAILFTRFAESDVTWAADRIDLMLSMQEMLTLLSFLEIKIDVQTKGKAITSYIGREGDTWDGIAALAYNDPTRANELRQVNNIRYGELPTPGRTYQIPQ